jgi:hypothetical protein
VALRKICAVHTVRMGDPAWILSWAGTLALKVSVVIALVAPRPATSAVFDKTVYLIDDFDGPTALQGWRFDSSPESSAAGGGLALGPGHREHGAVLAYRLPCGRETGCNAYAAARWRPSSPLPKRRDPALSLWVRFPAEVEVTLEVRDSDGQTLRLPILATIEHPKAGDWRYVVLSLSAKDAGGIRGRLVEIGVVVQARAGVTAPKAILQGSVSFDEVRLRESAETFHIDGAAEAGAPVSVSSELPPHLGVNIHLLHDDPALDLAHAAGFDFVRMDMLWANVERRGRYRFFLYDRLLRALEARGMGVLWILDYGHPDHGGSTPRMPADVAAFGRFAEAAAEHFKGRNVRYEIWNEPNTSQFWKPSPKASEYAILLKEAVTAIRRADPLAKVSSGGLSRFDAAFLSGAVDPGLAADLTAIGVHPYPKTGPETIAPEIENLREWAARSLGKQIEIWDTEWGYSSANAPEEAPSNGHTEEGRRRQASLSIREILTVWAVGLPLAVWYDLRDDGTDPANPEHNYGLLDSSGNEKPAIKAIRTLMSVISGRKYAGMIPETPEGIHAMRMDSSADTMLIVWTDQMDGRRRIEYPMRNLISATDVMGQALKSKDGHSGHAEVEIDGTAGPIYLLWRSGSRAGLHPDPTLPNP